MSNILIIGWGGGRWGVVDLKRGIKIVNEAKIEGLKLHLNQK
jgi:hypothetical protein